MVESTSPVTAGASALEQAPPSTSPARLSRFFRSSALRTSEEEAAASTVGKAISISTQDHNIATSISIDEALDWSVDDVCKWLEQNGLNQLQNKFKVHDIDGNVLFELGHSALKDMGVQRVGDRMRVLLCVKRLRQGVRFVKRDGLAAATTETATPTNGSKLLRKFSLIMPRGSSADRPANENATNDDRSTLAARQRSKKPSPISTGLSLLNSSSPLTSTTSSGSSSFLYRTGSPIEDAAASAAEAQAKLPPRPSSMAMAPPSLVYSSPGVLFERISTIQRRESRALSTGASPVSSIGHHTSRSVTPLASPPITAESLALLAKEDDPEQEEEQQKAVARNTTSPPSPSTIIMTYDSVRRNCIRVVGPEYVTHIINIGDLLDDVHAIKLRIMEHFQITNAFEQTQYRIAFLQHGINKEPLPVNDDELLEICRSTDRPEKERLLLHRPEVTRTLHRQSTIGRLSRLFTSSTLISGKSKMHSSGTTLNVQRPPTPPPHKQEPTQKRFSPSKRPPSQIISHNLGLFFPATFDKPIATSLHEATTAGSSVASAAAVLVSDDHVKTIEYLVQKRASSNSAKRRQSGASVHASLNEPSSARNLQRRSVDQGKSMINRLDGTMRRNSDVPVRFRQSQWSVVAQEAFQPPLRSPDSRRWSLFLKRQSRLVATDDNIDSHALRPPTINTDLATLNKATLVDTPTDGDPIECETGLRNWIKGDLIGRGSFASVFYGVNPITGEIMAVKQVELPSAKSSSLRIGRSGRSSDRRAKMVKALQLEIELLKTLEHENIVAYLGSYSDGTSLNVFLEYVSGGSIASILERSGFLPVEDTRNYVRQILCGLGYLHNRCIVHRDIKGANVLVSEDGIVKISDFGVAKIFDTLHANARFSIQGSAFWMAPEIVRREPFTPKADIWSLGCLILEMTMGDHPWTGYDQVQAMYQVGAGNNPLTHIERRTTTLNDELAERRTTSVDLASPSSPLSDIPEDDLLRVDGDSKAPKHARRSRMSMLFFKNIAADMLNSPPPASPRSSMSGASFHMPRIEDRLSSSARNFVQCCFIADVGARPAASELLRHEFVHVRCED